MKVKLVRREKKLKWTSDSANVSDTLKENVLLVNTAALHIKDSTTKMTSNVILKYNL